MLVTGETAAKLQNRQRQYLEYRLLFGKAKLCYGIGIRDSCSRKWYSK